MARGFRRRGGQDCPRYAAKLDPWERAAVAALMQQVVQILTEDAAPAPPSRDAPEPGASPFDEIVAGLGDLGALGVSVAAADQQEWPDLPAAPETARSFGTRDPALERLLPSACHTDEQAAAEFRRFTEANLRRHKVAHLTAAMEALGRGNAVELSPPDAVGFVQALTDVRLVLGERLGLRFDEDVERLERDVAQRDSDDPVVYALALYDFLTWLQESLSLALLADQDR